MVFVKAYAITLVVFLGLDFLWLGFVARRFYASQLSGHIRKNINYLAAGIFYLAYVAGIVFFAIAPALTEGSWRDATIHGALLGLLAYGTYDITNMATLKNWPIAISFVDIIWGCALTGLSSLLGFLIVRALT